MKVNLVNKVLFSIIVLIIAFLASCKEQEQYVPYVRVNFTVDLNINNSLTTPGYSQKYEYDGYAGVIVYCSFYDFATPSNSQYYAYDAACSFEMSDSCSVVNENNGITATCPCCSTSYSLMDGYPISGEAQYPLKEYNVTLLNNKLFISN